ncbi:Mur ligase family protein, partial [Alphaproteobacteria bacterium]|nr:Mur ligase family protein [Alphaproteobacteria bacterium]
MQQIFKKILFLKDKYQSNIVFDTRLLSQNDIFIGIGNDFKNGSLHYDKALKKGSKLVIINDKKIKHKNVIYIQNIDRFIKSFCKYLLLHYKGKIVAVTGSVGKTTIKENIYNILSQNNFSVSKSYKNYNNLLGLQFSIMNINLHNKYSIFELGINNPGEMKKLVKVLRPHYCLITCIENSHIGNFKNFNNLIVKSYKSKKLNIYDHSYNASPYSLKKQLMIFKQRKLMHKLCIIGSMKELG